GHDAKRAEAVASLLDRDECGDAARSGRRAARRLEKIEFVFYWKFRIDHAPLAGEAVDEGGEAMIALRADDEVDDRSAAQNFLAVRLRNTAGDRNRHRAVVAGGGLLQFSHAAEFRIDLLGGFLADMAGIEDDEVGILGRGGFDKAMRRQNVRH